MPTLRCNNTYCQKAKSSKICTTKSVPPIQIRTRFLNFIKATRNLKATTKDYNILEIKLASKLYIFYIKNVNE